MIGAAAPVRRRTLSREAARRFYDRFGRKQEAQWCYEQPAIQRLLTRGAFREAAQVFEFGVGTGHVAELLLTEWLGRQTSYVGCDISPTMVALAGARLARFGGRARVEVTDGSPRIAAPDGAFDRFVSTYVVDLLSPDDIAALLEEVHRVLRDAGRLCLVSLTRGVTAVSRATILLWRGLYAIHPALVGGCRPVELLELLPGERWQACYRDVVVAYGIPSEVVVACKR